MKDDTNNGGIGDELAGEDLHRSPNNLSCHIDKDAIIAPDPKT